MDGIKEIWESLPPWLWSKIMIITGLIVIFLSLNYAAVSSRRKRNKWSGSLFRPSCKKFL